MQRDRTRILMTRTCLTTWEARDLLGWSRSAVESTPGPIDFTEPNLSFAVTADSDSRRMVVVTFKARRRGQTSPT